MLSGAVRQVGGRVGARAFHSSRVVRGGHPEGYEYLHAKYMYNLREKPAAKWKAGLLIFGGVGIAFSIPLFAVDFNQRKAGLK